MSPNAHGRVARSVHPRPRRGGSPARPRRLLSWSTTSRSADSPSRRSAFGESRSEPSGIRSKSPWRAQLAFQFGQRAGVDAGLLAQLRPPARRGRCPPAARPDSTATAARPARRAGRAPPSRGWPRPCPAGCRRGTGPATSSPPPAACPAAARRAGPAPAPAAGRRTPAADSSASSARCSALIELSIRCAAAARWASRSTSSSVFCGFSGKNSPCSAHELGELLLRVLPLRVVREQGVQVVEHLPDPLDVARRHVLHRLLHPGEALVQHLPAQQVPDLLVGLASIGGAPVVGVELAHRPAGVRRERVELHLAEAGVVGVFVRQCGALGLQRACPAARAPPAGCRRAGCRAAAGCAAATPGGSGRPGRACPPCRGAAARAAPRAARSPP